LHPAYRLGSSHQFPEVHDPDDVVVLVEDEQHPYERYRHPALHVDGVGMGLDVDGSASVEGG
jgi:hypothetical protein